MYLMLGQVDKGDSHCTDGQCYGRVRSFERVIFISKCAIDSSMSHTMEDTTVM